MSKNDYTKFDAELIAQIKAGRNKMMLLDQHKPLIEMAKPFCANSKSPYGDMPEWRIVDRRLQALRKAGRLNFSRQRGVWEVVEKGGR